MKIRQLMDILAMMNPDADVFRCALTQMVPETPLT